jgi:thiosulfate dehydrogenase (quinone) large subunit
MIAHKSLPTTMSHLVLLPLRLFLGITFIYAGVQKLTDPQFFNPFATGYIGKQIIAFANSSPLHAFLLQFIAPHASLFGLLIAYGEIAIGLGTLLGFLLRTAAFFGAVLSIIFFLTATWRVYPYFYGSDIVFTFCWITFILNGPLNTGLPSIDEWLTVGLLQSASPQRQLRLAQVLHVFLGTANTATQPTSTSGQNKLNQPIQSVRRRQSVAQRAKETRRSFLLGALTGAGSFLGLSAFGYALRILLRGSDLSSIGDNAVLTQPPPTPVSTTAPGSTTATTSVIAQVSGVPSNSAVTFTIPSNNDPGVLIHLSNGNFVAYDALCTHAGCPVDYDPGSHLLLCPCHGAAFDPAKGGAVVQPPAETPLAALTIRVDSATGAITLAN